MVGEVGLASESVEEEGERTGGGDGAGRKPVGRGERDRRGPEDSLNNKHERQK